MIKLGRINFGKKKVRESETPSFELLRAAVESGVHRPGVVAVTSAVPEDGKTAASYGLAASLGAIGYRTLLIDGAAHKDAIVRPATGSSIEEMLLDAPSETVIPKLRVVSLAAPALREASLPSVAQALTAVRSSGRYDYVVVNAGCVLGSAFSAHIVNSADAVLVAIRAGRRRHVEDAQLTERLGQIVSRFFGIVAIEPSIVESPPILLGLRGSEIAHRSEHGRLDPDAYLRAVRPGVER
jgi:Mrp family chromosome partitioning ATPase